MSNLANKVILLLSVMQFWLGTHFPQNFLKNKN